MDELKVGSIVNNGFSIGIKNAGSIAAAVALWVLTMWIPYINLGTTIALVGIIAAMAKGNVISPTSIFDKKYRERIGEFFLVNSFVNIGIVTALISSGLLAGASMVVFMNVFGIPTWLSYSIAGIAAISAYLVVFIAWSLAVLLVIDKGLNPSEALAKSNELTYGKKVSIFFGFLIIGVIIFIVGIILSFILNKIGVSILTTIVMLIYLLLISPILMGCLSYVYGTLTKNM